MPLNFQQAIPPLQQFWADRGAIVWQPYYTQVGAGTMNPATFLRVLGPEPWNAAYVEPSTRPDDGRYGDNPNRFQQHYQFQLILKPDPGNPQEIYLDSLKAPGPDPRQHGIRFVEDNWEQPAISAWGLGWEVWLDGQEITQFTYFQQMGGLELDPVPGEVTYALERTPRAPNPAPADRDAGGARVVVDRVARPPPLVRVVVEHLVARRHAVVVDVAAGVVGVRVLGPAYHHPTEVEQRVADRGHLPVDDRGEPPRRAVVEHHVGELVVAVEDPGHVALGLVVAQP